MSNELNKRINVRASGAFRVKSAGARPIKIKPVNRLSAQKREKIPASHMAAIKILRRQST